MGKHGLAQALLKLQEKLDKKKKEKAELTGEYNSFISRLENEFSISEGEDIQKNLDDLDHKLSDLDESMRDKIQEATELFEVGKNDNP